ncbi:uncharacterized protein F5891DRAFT_1195068 [Suillus fuscotomentosus]|uniref:Uncharacterized protein n=1 Tax=Suillus fuscotomentosus TaxID=1912939 RepID=A0AAD4HFU4_9AGAM|nr:uncharacterized protein F5891DRAFT_1195068 [Suillus fuscotomentosus]KAG1894626.1 hypothetical protein F5891DRAFT_1195068 [Suillus fuscotomentosus]
MSQHRDDQEIEALAENRIIEDTGIVLCCRILYMLHMSILHKSDVTKPTQYRPLPVSEPPQPTRSSPHSWSCSDRETQDMQSSLFHGSTSVNGIVNDVDVRAFIDDFSSQAKSQITLAGVSVAMDVAILAIPGLGTTETSRMLCSCSLLLGVGCIFAATMVQHFGERMRSIDFAVQFTSYYCSLTLTLLIEQYTDLLLRTKVNQL